MSAPGAQALREAAKRLHDRPVLFWDTALYLIGEGLVFALVNASWFEHRWLLALPVRVVGSLLLFPLFCGVLRTALRPMDFHPQLFSCYHQDALGAIWPIWWRTGLPMTILLAVLMLFQRLMIQSGHPALWYLPLSVVVVLELLWLQWKQCCLLERRLTQLDGKVPLHPKEISRMARRRLRWWGSLLWRFLLGVALVGAVGSCLILVLLLATGGFPSWIPYGLLWIAASVILPFFWVGSLWLAGLPEDEPDLE